MMFCWQVRSFMSDLTEEGPSGNTPAPVRRHLDGCESCRKTLEDLRRVASMVKESASGVVPPAALRDAADGFEDRVLRELRARSLEAHRAQAEPRFLMAPVPLGVAIVLVVAVLLIGLYFGGLVATDGFEPRLVANQAAPDSGTVPAPILEETDSRDIPFLVRQDLVGPRRGRIPTVTYVLEPPPEEPDVDAVLRASY